MNNPVSRVLKDIVLGNRRSRPFRALAAAAEKYLRTYYNEDFYDFSRNGEGFAIDTLAKVLGGRACAVWDVGANHGEWARELHRRLPQASVTSFEIVPEIAAEIEIAAEGSGWWQVVAKGMSDHAGEIEVAWNRSFDQTSAVAPNMASTLYRDAEYVRIACSVTTLDSYWRDSGTAPVLLKIDVEGHEAAVLEGGEALFRSTDAPSLIQFEYGYTWTGTQRLLQPVQQHLEELGYSVGRLYPHYVDFRSFTLGDEHFRMGNMIAARDPRLIAALSGR